jgi:hypothetical protein
VSIIDLRDSDRITVRLSDEAMAARDTMMKERMKKKGKDT